MRKNSFFLNEDNMTQFIKELLSMSDEAKYITKNMYSTTIFKFKGNNSNVQKRIFEWLSVSERKKNFEVLSDKQSKEN